MNAYIEYSKLIKTTQLYVVAKLHLDYLTVLFKYYFYFLCIFCFRLVLESI